MGVDPVTEKPVPVYPIHKTWIKEYLVSLPLVFVCLFLAFKVMMFYFAVEAATVQYCKQNPSFMNGALVHLPGVGYALVVIAISHFYRIFADKLNNWENHRTQSSHEGHLIIKLVMFEFVNNFMSIFYVAFYIQDMSMLKWQIGTLLVVNQIVDNIQEVFLPLWASRKSNEEISLVKKQDLTEDSLKIIRESKLPVYENTYFDYLELYIQFGHVFLFASVFPFAPILALINNLVEIRSDSFKLCYAFQRPHQRSADGINGGWM
ncbi:anoctamin-8-like protein 3, partial [Leptotrombidium deliense]